MGEAGFDVGVAADSHISGSMMAVICRYVERVVGEAAMREMLDRAGDARALDEITSLSGWSSYPQACALFEAAVEVTGDPHVGFRIGEEMLRQHSGTEVAALLRSLGSPGEVLRNIAATGSKYSTVTRLDVLSVGDRAATVTGEAVSGFIRHRLLCDYTAGVLSQVSALFGMEPAVVDEVECQVRGADRCIYEVRWEPAESTDYKRRAEHLEIELAALTERFESFQATAAEMVSATDVDTLLGRIADRAGLAVRAPGHVLAVSMPGETDVRVHARGIGDEKLSRIVADLSTECQHREPNGVLAVDVTSARHCYGRLAAVYPGGTAFFADEQRLLTAFASQAAAALDTASAMGEVTRRNDTARALLVLASALADVASRDEAAHRIAMAVPEVVDCDAAQVFLWDPTSEGLAMRACTGLSERIASSLYGITLTPTDTPILRGPLSGRMPFLLDRNHGDPVLRGLLDITEQIAAAVVPIYATSEFLGVVTASVSKDAARLSDGQDSMERLGGVAAHAAAALRNANLLDELSHRALHDPLTGLPNRTLLRDRLSHALARARRGGPGRVGVLIIDLDNFKHVNDTHGHACGDSVLLAQAQRIRAALRPGDTIARMGGDEFAVVLPDIQNASACETVASKLLLELGRPIAVDGHKFTVSASIGAVAGSGHDSYDGLLKRADVAMYHAKGSGRNAFAVAGLVKEVVEVNQS